MKVEDTMGPLGHLEELGLYFEVFEDLKKEIKCFLICLKKQKKILGGLGDNRQE